jgi:hypothetical protein
LEPQSDQYAPSAPAEGTKRRTYGGIASPSKMAQSMRAARDFVAAYPMTRGEVDKLTDWPMAPQPRRKR